MMTSRMTGTGTPLVWVIATKDDIKRLETQREVMLANQNIILENLRGISNLFNEKAKKRGISFGHAES